MKSFPLLNDATLEKLNDALHCMNMAELKKLSAQLNIPVVSKKGMIINRIVTYLKSGKIAAIPEMPAQSKAKKHTQYPLEPSTLMLYGNYKNDLATRNFMKTLVGNHFHFTAFGIDWLQERWMQGNPPTYQEFAQFWSQEMQKRKLHKASPKKEWAYITFIQNYLDKHPTASHATITKAWKDYRDKQAAYAIAIIDALKLS